MSKEFKIYRHDGTKYDDETLIEYLVEGYHIISAVGTSGKYVQYVLERDNISKQVFG